MSQFTGFPPEGLAFLADLAANNEKAWFEAHKTVYQRALLEPAQDFIADLGDRLRRLAPNIQYDTRTNGQGSLMRIYRDTRFSQDKTPYKDNISGLFWEGPGKKTECAAFGFRLRSAGLDLMAGMFGFSKDLLDRFRAAVDYERSGEELREILINLGMQRGYALVGDHYKRLPQGYREDHPRADLLRFNALYVHPLQPIPPKEVQTAALVDLSLDHFEIMAPIQRWLVNNVLN